MRPYFTAAITAGTYHIRVVEDFGGSPTNVDTTVVIPTDCYWVPSSSYATHSTIWKVLCDAITTQSAATGNTWTYTVSATTLDDNAGIIVTLSSGGGGTFKLDYTNSPSGDDGKLALEWLGWASADDPDTGILTLLTTDDQPKFTWWPKCHWDSPPDVPETAPVFSSGLTADGSEHFVNHSDATLRYWRTFRTLGGGFHGARASKRFLNSSVVDWGTSAGFTDAAGSRPTWGALDGSGGWWELARKGVKWLYVEDEANPTTSIESEYRISYDDDAPVSNTDFRGLRGMVEVARLGARQTMLFSGLEVT